MLHGLPLTVLTLLKKFWGPIGITWVLTILETVLMSLIPLFIGFAIDDLLEKKYDDFIGLILVMAALLVIAVCRRVYDTRVFGGIRVELGKTLAARSKALATSVLNARIGMGRELADFLEEQAPQLMTSLIQLFISTVVLYMFHPTLAFAALGAVLVMMLVYSLFHGHFYRLNSAYNQQEEKQVGTLETRDATKIQNHLQRLKTLEIKFSDAESIVYGLIFLLLLGFVSFSLWFSASFIDVTVGKIFSVISYSWSFVEAALILPITLQGWSRLSEIMKRINAEDLKTELKDSNEGGQG